MKASYWGIAFAFLGLSLVPASGADIDRINKKKVESATINQLLPAVEELHKLAKEDSSLEREISVWKVVPEAREKEWQAIRQLVDRANGFATVESGDEQATAFKVTKPAFRDIATAADYSKDKEEMSEALQAAIASLQQRISQFIKHVDHLAFYRILSSNEAQGHHGFVFYNRHTFEALYVSSISDH